MDAQSGLHATGTAADGHGYCAGHGIRPAPEPLPPLLAAAFEHVPQGMMIVTTPGRLLYANKLALAATRRCDIRVDPDGHLAALRPADAAVLHRALTATAGLRHSLIRIGPQDRPDTVTVRPLLLHESPRPATCAVLMFARNALCDAVTATAFGRAAGLTAAELVVLAALLEAQRAQEVAASLCSSIATVRSHLRSIYRKTGSRNLHELMAQLVALPPLGPLLAANVRTG